MTNEGRPRRVAELIKAEIARLITRGLKDPRIGFVSIMDVTMSKDLRFANVHVSVYGDERQRKSSLIGLRNATGWIRREVGKAVRLHHTPELRFFEDDSLDRVYHLEEVFREIHEDDEDSDDAEV